MANKMVPKHAFLLKKNAQWSNHILNFCYIYINNASITRNMCFLYIHGFLLETCHIIILCMESLIIYLHGNVNNSKCIFFKSSFRPTFVISLLHASFPLRFGLPLPFPHISTSSILLQCAPLSSSSNGL